MAGVCFVTTCMGRLTALRQSLGPMLAQPDASCVVVDYSCPDGAADWVVANQPSVRVVRVPGQSHFNLAAARNAGARLADAPWICFVDADVTLERGFSEALSQVLAPGGYYRVVSGDGGIGGTFACSRTDFERVGGYDEVIRGWGEEDNDLYDALQFVGLERRSLPATLLRHLPHGDDERTRFYPVADRLLGHAVNRVYRILKWDTARLNRELLSLEMRRTLYDKIAEVVTGSIATGRTGDLAVQLPHGIVPGGWSLKRQLSYRLTRDA
jgi:glycosyltransferase involved in cell wall biosynthesis